MDIWKKPLLFEFNALCIHFEGNQNYFTFIENKKHTAVDARKQSENRVYNRVALSTGKWTRNEGFGLRFPWKIIKKVESLHLKVHRKILSKSSMKVDVCQKQQQTCETVGMAVFLVKMLKKLEKLRKLFKFFKEIYFVCQHKSLCKFFVVINRITHVCGMNYVKYIMLIKLQRIVLGRYQSFTFLFFH